MPNCTMWLLSMKVMYIAGTAAPTLGFELKVLIRELRYFSILPAATQDRLLRVAERLSNEL